MFQLVSFISLLYSHQNLSFVFETIFLNILPSELKFGDKRGSVWIFNIWCKLGILTCKLDLKIQISLKSLHTQSLDACGYLDCICMGSGGNFHQPQDFSHQHFFWPAPSSNSTRIQLRLRQPLKLLLFFFFHHGNTTQT